MSSISLYIYNLQNFTLIEFVLQLFLLYNLYQLFFCINFFYMLAYFLNFNLYLGVYLLIFDLDIFAVILWLIYGGVVIIFFMYTLLWSELSNFLVFPKNFKTVSLVLVFIIYINSYELINFFDIQLFNSVYDCYYSLLNIDNTEELDNLGWLLLYVSTYYFLLVIYLLLFSCCSLILIILNSKKIRYYFYLQNAVNSELSLLKFQNFYLQDFYSLKRNNKYNYTINNNFCKFKPNFRRV